MTDIDENGESLKQYSWRLLNSVIRLAILMFFDALLFVVWRAIDVGLDRFAEYIGKSEAHIRCEYLLREVAPWFFFAIALLNLLKDIFLEAKSFWREVRR